MRNNSTKQYELIKNQQGIFNLIAYTTRKENLCFLNPNLIRIKDYIDRCQYADLVKCNPEGYSILKYILSIPVASNIRVSVFHYIHTKLEAFLPKEYYFKLFENGSSEGTFLSKAIDCGAEITLQILDILKQPGFEGILKENLTYCDENGNMPLQQGVIECSLNITRALIDLLKEINDISLLERNLKNTNKRGTTILMNALITHRESIIKTILNLLEEPNLASALEANLNCINEEGFSILQSAHYSGFPETFQHLLRILKQPAFKSSLNLNLTHVTNAGYTILHQVCSSGSSEDLQAILVILESSDYEDILIKNLNAVTQEGMMVINSALFSKNPEIVSELLKCLKKPKYKKILQANLNNIPVSGFSALHSAVCADNFALVNSILTLMKEYLSEEECIAKFNKTTKEGFSILLHTLCCKELEIFGLIVSILERPEYSNALEINLSAVTKDSFMVLQSALKNIAPGNVKEIVRLLKKPELKSVLEANLKNHSKGNFSILQQALASKNAENISLIFSLLQGDEFETILEENLNNVTTDGFMVLLDAIKSANVDILDQLIDVLKMPKYIGSLMLNLQYTNRFGYNCLHQAINSGNYIILSKLDALLDFAYGENSILEKRKLLSDQSKIRAGLFKSFFINEYLERLFSPAVPSIPKVVEKDDEIEEGEIETVSPSLIDAKTSKRSKIVKEKIEKTSSPNGGIEDKYLGGTLPQLPEPDNESSEKTNSLIYNQSYKLTSLKELLKEEKHPSPHIIKINTAEFKVHFITYRHYPVAEEIVSFIVAGRKEEALVPLPKNGARCVLVLCEDEYKALSSKLIPYFDVLLIKSLQSESHGIYTKLQLPTCRRLAIFMAAHHFNFQTFLMIDDNIKCVKFNSAEVKWNGLYNLLKSQLKNSLCISVKTESNKINKPGMLGSKIFMINMQALKKQIPDIKDLFILFPQAKNQDYWGEDYYFQVAFYDLMKKNSQGYQVLDEKIACLQRSTRNTNAFAAAGKQARAFDVPGPNDLSGLSARHKECVQATLATLNHLIADNIKRYAKNTSLIEEANLLQAHALANGIIPQAKKTELIFSQDEVFMSRFKGIIEKLSFIPTVFREYQIKAVKNIAQLEKFHAKLTLPTGSGKTYVQCEYIRLAYHCAKEGEHIIYVTPHIDLVNQFYQDFIDFNDKVTTSNANLAVPPQDVLKICSHRESCSVKTLLMNKGIVKQKSIMIFCVDSLDKYLKESDFQILNIPMFVLDEFHYYSSTVQNLVSNFINTKALILGSSATPPDDTILTETIYHYPRNQGVKEGFLAPIIADSLGVDFSEQSVQDLIQCLPLILRQYHPGFVNAKRLKDSKGVIYLPSIEECDDAQSILRHKKIKAFSIHSQNPSHKKDLQCFMESDEPGILLAVKMLRMGFNIKDLAWVIIAQNPKDDMGGRADVEQEIGRVMRKLGDKIGYVLCFDNVYKNIVAPMLMDQPVTLPVNPDYLSQENVFFKDENGAWQVLDALEINLDEEYSILPGFSIIPHQIIDFQIQPRTFECEGDFRNDDLMSYIYYDRISECLFPHYADYKKNKKKLIEITPSATENLPAWCHRAEIISEIRKKSR